MNLVMEDRGEIARYYTVDAREILHEYNRSRGRLAEYVDYREKWEQSPPPLSIY